MNLKERDGEGGRRQSVEEGEVKDQHVEEGEEKDQHVKSDQNVIKDRNGKEEISVKLEGETSGLGEKVKEEVDNKVKVKEKDKVKKEEEDGVEILSRLGESGKPWISTIYNTGLSS